MRWTIAEDGVCIEEYEGGMGWEDRAAARLPERTAAACMGRGAYLHLRSSGWMRDEMRRMGLQPGEPIRDGVSGRFAARG